MNSDDEIIKAKVVDLNKTEYIFIKKFLLIAYFSDLKRIIYEFKQFTYYSIIFRKMYVYLKPPLKTTRAKVV